MQLETQEDILNKAIEYFGKNNQINKAIEEMAELTAELARFSNNKGMNVNLIEEIADVSIMLEQMKMIFGSELVEGHKANKIRRLRVILESNPLDLK